MLPHSLLLSITSFLGACAADVAFTSHHQLKAQQPFAVQDQDHRNAFGPSPSLSLPISRLKTVPTTVYRPRSLNALHRVRQRSLFHGESELEPVEWDEVEVEGPDVRDIHTLAQLGRMSGNAYALPGKKNWYDVDHAWNRSFPFGWEEHDGFRGHVFLSSDNSTIVLSIKGTTLQGPTSKLDKFNDNLLFSCCCARVDVSWVFRTVCDCYAGHQSCDDQCLTDALVQDSLFYSVGVKLIDDLRMIYPSANLWLVGHSLGGALASLLGATYGLPAVAFESPGERLAANRLHLPLPPPIAVPAPDPPSKRRLRHRGIWPFPSKDPEPAIPVPTSPSPYPPGRIPISTTHVYHTADPIPQGRCTGFGSPCSQAGYALETRCHLGQSIIFDTVNDLGWPEDIRWHVIKEVVHDVLESGHWGNPEEDDEDGHTEPLVPGKKKKKGDDEERRAKKKKVPEPIFDEECFDCPKWKFGDFKDDLERIRESGQPPMD